MALFRLNNERADTTPYYEPHDEGGRASGGEHTRSAQSERSHTFWSILRAFVFLTLALALGSFAGYSLPREPVYTYSLSVPFTASSTELVEGSWPALSNLDFFTSVEQKFVEEKANFLVANLSTMNLTVFREGQVATSVPIKSKGREGSWWETPAGLYRAESKSPNHFSSFGQVNMPWSIPFQGNFFIHGWPTYPDGTPVSSTYSGGCIRLEDHYAKVVYDLTDVGMPILVYEDDFSHDTYRYRLNAPDILAESYLVADLKNGFVLLSSNPAEVQGAELPAKLMTALVASEYKNIEGMLRGPDVVSTTSRMQFEAGAMYSLYDLLFPLLLEGSDDAAEAIAASFGTERFVGLMNTKAKAIGMEHTRYIDPAGSREGSVTTAEDVFLLARYLLSNRPFVLSLTAGTLSTAWYGKPVWESMEPLHPFASTTGFLGGVASNVVASGTIARALEQTGGASQSAGVLLAFATSSRATSTSLGQEGVHDDMVSVFSLPFSGEERPVLFVVFDSPDPVLDTERMLAHVRSMYR